VVSDFAVGCWDRSGRKLIFFLTGLFMFVGAVIGMLVLATGAYAEKANMLHLKPFDNSYKKARESYKVENNEENESK
jgi:hypothetical protein